MDVENIVFLELYRESQKNIPDMRSITALNLGIPDDVFNYVLYKLQEKEIISGLRVMRNYAGEITKVYTSGVRLTRNARSYYDEINCNNVRETKSENEIQKKRKIFISHSSSDIEYVRSVVELMEDIGVPEDGIFCSSLSGYNIPLGMEITDYISKQLSEYQIKAYIIFSSNFNDSTFCLNEVGALWILHLDPTLIFLPGFAPNQMEGVLNPKKTGIKLDDNINIVKGRLREMRDELVSFFSLSKMSEDKWERKRDKFILAIENNYVMSAH
ncbi:MAG: hypothetical protein HDR09_07250 [Lachnospiraceae bacterium]|nr:hypothetical protein [Lachnospiraceae bacterium]